MFDITLHRSVNKFFYVFDVESYCLIIERKFFSELDEDMFYCCCSRMNVNRTDSLSTSKIDYTR